MAGYYTAKLAAKRLKRVYDLAPPRIRQYLKAEADYVLDRIKPGDRVLDLGCGYGRVMGLWAANAGLSVGVDTAIESLIMGRNCPDRIDNTVFAAMDAGSLGFKEAAFDITACIQNGISAFKVDPEHLLKEAFRVTKIGGKVLFSSYASSFWDERLNWFRIQADHGLLGEIDEEATGDGAIICIDGFKATTFGPEDLLKLTKRCGFTASVTEVDGSSVFCEIDVY